MTNPTERRAGALSKDRIVKAAIDILNEDGETALTFRALAGRLQTGAGALYWHVADKDELVAAATEGVIAGVLPSRSTGDLRDLALAVFDAVEAQPWVGAQLSRAPWQPAVGRIFEAVGQRLQALGIAEAAQFDAASALVNYMLGAAAQPPAASGLPKDTDRAAFLAAVAARWMRDDPAAFPFVERMKTQLRDHDDRAQFLAGIDLILAGIKAQS